MTETAKPGGLAGIVAGRTSLATVGKQGKGLTYRGYSIEDLAEHVSFEETAHLLLYGNLPTTTELDQYRTRLVGMRDLPEPSAVNECNAADLDSDGDLDLADFVAFQSLFTGSRGDCPIRLSRGELHPDR